MGSEVTNDKKKKGEITDVISKWIPLLTGIIPLIVAAINVILIFLNYDYSRKAEDFYGVPGRYFVNSIIDEKIIVFVFMIASLAIMFSPFIIRKLLGVNKFGIFESISYSILIALFAGIIVLYFFIKINTLFNFNISINILIIIAVLLAVLILLLYIYLFLTDFKKVRVNKSDTQKNDYQGEVKEGNIASSDKQIKTEDTERQRNKKKKQETNKNKVKDNKDENLETIENKGCNAEASIKTNRKINYLIYELFVLLASIIVTTIIASIIFLTADRIIEKPQNKTKYEIVAINDGDKGNKRDMAVVSYKNGKAVLMEFTVTPEAINGKEIEILQLTKGKYRLSDIEGHQIEYKEFNAVKCE